MGVIYIETTGSFPRHSEQFCAIENGHAHAVAQAIEWLSREVLPVAIEQDHRLQTEGASPRQGFTRPAADEIDRRHLSTDPRPRF